MNIGRCFTAYALLFSALWLTACRAQAPQTPVFHAQDNPAQLSAWNIIRLADDQLYLNDGVLPYDLNTPLFTDYAHKLRTIWMPEGMSATYTPETTFNFPVGTIISKTFYYPLENKNDDTVLTTSDNMQDLLNTGFYLSGVKLIETRLLVHREAGWVALPYVWNEAQTDAILKRVGDITPVNRLKPDGTTETFSYVIPNVNQCAGCHATNATRREITPIGPKARHLNKNTQLHGDMKNQLLAWTQYGVLTGLPSLENIAQNAQWNDPQARLNDRARAYLDINCSHCHNPVGPADTSGLNLEPHAVSDISLGICKLPIAAGTGTGDRAFDIVPGEPQQSIFIYRMASTNPASMMPELGRSTVHAEGVDLIAAWISEMEGGCRSDRL